MNKTPRPIGDFAHVSKVDYNRVTDSYSVLNRELALPVPPSRPIEYLPQLVSTVDVPPRIEQQTADLLKGPRGRPGVPGQKTRRRRGCRHLPYHEPRNRPPLDPTEFAEPADVATATIRTKVDT